MSLKFLHPHDETYVYDLSEVIETTDNAGTVLFQPYLSDKGVDGVIERLTDVSKFLREKGNPNYKKHGQSIYQIVNWLTGGGIVYGVRLTAPDSYYANTILNVKTKVIQTPSYQKDSDGNYVKDANNNRIPLVDTLGNPVLIPGIEVKLSTENLASLRNVSTLISQLNALPATDANGYKNHYIFAFIAKGRGEYGNKYSYQISLNTAYEKDYAYRMYNIDCFLADAYGNLNTVDQTYLFSTYPDSLTEANVPQGLKEVMDVYSSVFNTIFHEAQYDELLDDIMEATKDTLGNYTFSDRTSIDFLYGLDKNSELYESIVMSADSVALDVYEGIMLAGGSDGLFSSSTSSTLRNAAIESALLEVYNGTLDSRLLNDKTYPIEVTMDANYSVAIKKAISNMVKMREDSLAVVDTGILNSVESTLAWRKNSFQDSTYYVAIFGQASTVYDAYTTKDLNVTQSFDLSYRIPYSHKTYGKQMPFVGPKRGIVENFKSINWIPDEYQKEDLYRARINYIEQDYKSTRYMSQNTSQLKTSALSDINNVLLLFEMKRKVKEAVRNYYFEYPDSTTLGSMSDAVNNILTEYVKSGACSVCSGSVSQTAYDKTMKTVRVYCNVTFVGTIERIVIDFRVGRS